MSRSATEHRYSDDEDLIYEEDRVSSESDDEEVIHGENVKMRIKYRKTGPICETKLDVWVDLMESERLSEESRRPGVDIVAILDVGAGTLCDQRKTDLQKNAMKFFISKLSPIDRLSVITFSANAKRMFPLTPMNAKDIVLDDEKMEEVIHTNNIAEAVNICLDHCAGHNCKSANVAAGLRIALQVLNDRVHFEGRKPAIVLLSASDPTSDAAQASLGDVPVHTFALGGDFPHERLKQIADKSNGGAFSILRFEDTESITNFNLAFSHCLARLLTIVAQDLKLTLTLPDAETKIDEIEINSIAKVGGKRYQLETGSSDTNSITVSLGHLHRRERCKVLVKLLLPRVDRFVRAKILQITYSSRDGVEAQFGPSGDVTVDRGSEDVISPQIRESVCGAMPRWESVCGAMPIPRDFSLEIGISVEDFQRADEKGKQPNTDNNGDNQNTDGRQDSMYKYLKNRAKRLLGCTCRKIS